MYEKVIEKTIADWFCECQTMEEVEDLVMIIQDAAEIWRDNREADLRE